MHNIHLLPELLQNAVLEKSKAVDIGTTGADFEETLDLVETVRFDSAFTFLYSGLRGTPAARYGGQVSETDKYRRFKRLVERLSALTAEKNKPLHRPG